MDTHCAYCTGQLGARVYKHEKGRHPEPRPAFCSHSCMGYYDNRRSVERRTFITVSAVALLTGIIATAIGVA